MKCSAHNLRSSSHNANPHIPSWVIWVITCIMEDGEERWEFDHFGIMDDFGNFVEL